MAFINKIATALPKYCHKQIDILEYMLSTYSIPKEMQSKVEAMYIKGGIEKRYSVLPDFNILSSRTLFAKLNPSVQDRMAVYNANATTIGVQAIHNLEIELKDITHLITVSCTGMCAPGLDITIMQKLGLRSNCIRTSVNFMGCYAAIHALKLANAFCETNKNANVVIVLVEFCTLHFQQNYTFENVATSMLFADGCAAIHVSNAPSTQSLEMKSFYSEVQDNSLQDMAWHITDIGFAMNLSAFVPTIIGENILELLQNAMQNGGYKNEAITHWAIHPGGKKIVSEIKNALQLELPDVMISNKILNDFGNMSSVTLAYVLQEVMLISKAKENIFAVAFGPGLTMETLILEAW
jgi:predicted naringenin-chalcone synthase